MRVRIPRGPLHDTPADVAQRQRRGAQNAVSVGSSPTVSTQHNIWTWCNGKRTGVGDRRWEFDSLRPDQIQTPCEMVEPAPQLPLKQEVQVRTLVSQPSPRVVIDASAVVTFLEIFDVGLLRR